MVLLVEDNADAREALRALLELDGYGVEAAADGARALEIVQARPPDIAAARALWVDLMLADGGAGVRDLLARFGTERMHPLVQWTQDREGVAAADFMRLLAEWNALRSRNLRFFDDFGDQRVIFREQEVAARPERMPLGVMDRQGENFRGAAHEAARQRRQHCGRCFIVWKLRHRWPQD